MIQGVVTEGHADLMGTFPISSWAENAHKIRISSGASFSMFAREFYGFIK